MSAPAEVTSDSPTEPEPDWEPNWDGIYCYKLTKAFPRATKVLRRALRPFKGAGETVDLAYRNWIDDDTRDDAKVSPRRREDVKARLHQGLVGTFQRHALVERMESLERSTGWGSFEGYRESQKEDDTVSSDGDKGEIQRIEAFCREHDVHFSIERVLDDPLRYIRVMGVRGHETLWMEVLCRLPTLPNNVYREREAIWFEWPWDDWYASWYPSWTSGF
ncbi:hypothetical protein PG997_013203 [Apiospora hydei]|uniref:Uncharacterized protein n=1 Tax=Apiospora hydei TaxID=1337664 RepID=A0ABR1V819_9PEZI